MASRARIALAAVCALMLVTIAAPAGAASSRTTTRWVDDDGKAGPTSCGGKRKATTSIQKAIDRSDRNDVVIVCPGTFRERISVVGARHRGMTVRAYRRGTAIIKPPATFVEGPLFYVEFVSGVTIKALVVSFPSGGCTLPREGDVQGLWVEEADGTRLIGNQVRATGSSTQGACGYDDGIRVLDSRNVRITGNVVRDFKSDGISFERGSRGTIDRNRVRFYHGRSGSDDDGDQGIRLVERSRAEVTRNLVRSLSGAGSPHLEIGIVVQNGRGVSDIHHNDVSHTKLGIAVIGSDARVASNDLVGIGEDAGIVVFNGTGTDVLDNDVRAFDVGIEVDAVGATLRRNDARRNVGHGCLDETTGGGTAGTANTWSRNVGSPASDPVGICRVP